MGYQVYLSLKGWQIVLCRVGELLLYKRTCWLEWPKETELLRLLSRYLIIVLFSDSSRRTGSIWFFSFAQYFPSFSANYFTVWKWINLINIHLFICVFFLFFCFPFFMIPLLDSLPGWIGSDRRWFGYPAMRYESAVIGRCHLPCCLVPGTQQEADLYVSNIFLKQNIHKIRPDSLSAEICNKSP